MARADRRRELKQKPIDEKNLAISEDYLKMPQHWHIDFAVYEYKRNEEMVAPIHYHNITSNDIGLATTWVLEKARRLQGVPRKEIDVEQMTFCSEEAHVNNKRVPNELVIEEDEEGTTDEGSGSEVTQG